MAYICTLCYKTEQECQCERFCTLCRSSEGVRLCIDGCYYCEVCREACDFAVEN